MGAWLVGGCVVCFLLVGGVGAWCVFWLFLLFFCCLIYMWWCFLCVFVVGVVFGVFVGVLFGGLVVVVCVWWVVSFSIWWVWWVVV